MFFNLINADKCNKNNNDTVAFNLPNIYNPQNEMLRKNKTKCLVA